MNFLRVNIMFYDVVNTIDDDTITANPYPYTAKFAVVSVRNNEN